MKPRTIRALLPMVVLVGVLAGCAPAYRGEPIAGPLDVSDPQLARGRQIFAVYCHQCHPGGAGGLGPSLNDKPLPGWLIAYQVRHGLGAMPAFSPERISDEELEALIHYLEQLRGHG